jgi:hypothetical protein
MRRINVSIFSLALLLALPCPALQAKPQKQAAAAAKAIANRPPAALNAAARHAAERITAAQLKTDLYWVADDARAGRDTPSAGLDETAKYVADRLAKAGIKPAGDKGSYFQKIDLRSTSIEAAETRAELAGRAFKLGDDFIIGSPAPGEAAGQLVYVGHGWVVTSKSINAYEGLDVKDKIVIVSGNGTAPPPGVPAEYIAAQPAADWESPVSYAIKHGAKGIVFIPQRFERSWLFGRRAIGRTAYQVESFVKSQPGTAQVENTLPAIIPSAEMLNAIFAGERQTGADVLKATTANTPGPGFDLSAGKRMSFKTAVKVAHATTQNVVGVLEGGDKNLKKEYVALGAHYDHIGVCRPGTPDPICNGADDDGSGTVSVLSIAEAFARGPRPKRSMLFVWHCGEEKGLWGSEYFTKNPTVPVKQIVAQLNIDMIGRSRRAGDTNQSNKMLTGPNEIYVIGSRVLSTEMGELNEAVNREYLNLKYNFHYDEPNDPEQLYSRSDHYNYALQGIPIAFFFDGVHEDYHQPGDSPDKIDYAKMEKVARTIFVLASEIANAPRRPLVDKELPAANRAR